MSKILQIVIYTSINDEEKLAAYAKLSAPAMQAKGGKVIARGMPVALTLHASLGLDHSEGRTHGLECASCIRSPA